MDVTLFSIMINRLLRDRNVRAKYVDDTIACEQALCLGKKNSKEREGKGGESL